MSLWKDISNQGHLVVIYKEEKEYKSKRKQI